VDAPNELVWGRLSDDDDSLAKIWDAVEAATRQGKITYLTEHGKRVAIIAPVEVGERYEEAMTVMVSGRHHGDQVPETPAPTGFARPLCDTGAGDATLRGCPSPRAPRPSVEASR
jgi:hypothetical protein